jgi:RimJ/RimL family protein N-acetyltransferase
VIRLPEMADAPVMRNFINTIVRENTYVSSDRIQTLKSERAFVRGKLEEIRHQDGVYLTAWVGKQLVGVAGIDRRGTSHKTQHLGLFGITVAKKFRAQGVGRQLMLACIDQAKQHVPGLRIIKLEVFAINAAALALYKKMGFKIYGRLPKGLLYKQKYEDDVLMYKTI